MADQPKEAFELHVPGLWYCPTCKFALTQFSLSASDGSVGVSDTPGEKCPNDGVPLERVTWKEHAEEIAVRCEEAYAELARIRAIAETPQPAHEAVIRQIANVASAVGWQSGEPAMEMAGQIVSVLATNPEHIARFMADGSALFIDGTLSHENGSLTYRAVNGEILSPSVLRRQKGMQQ